MTIPLRKYGPLGEVILIRRHLCPVQGFLLQMPLDANERKIIPSCHALAKGIVFEADINVRPTLSAMPSATVSQEMPCDSVRVFDLLHDYSRRLAWDSLLREARLTQGHTVAAKGATSLCVGRPLFGLIGIETRYITFSPGAVAAVEMVNRPLFFESFVASIRHADTVHGSVATYKFQFIARPAILRWILHPIMLYILRHETSKRLQALAAYLTNLR